MTEKILENFSIAQICESGQCFRMEEMQKTYLQYENMKKIDDIDLKTETDSILKLSSLLDDKKKIVVRISNAACVSCIQDFCAVLFQYFSGSEIIYISDYGSAGKATRL